jgi:hypothetical protein
MSVVSLSGQTPRVASASGWIRTQTRPGKSFSSESFSRNTSVKWILSQYFCICLEPIINLIPVGSVLFVFVLLVLNH